MRPSSAARYSAPKPTNRRTQPESYQPKQGLPADRLWRQFRGGTSADARDCLLRHYLPLVDSIARYVRRRASDAVSLDDLKGAGTLGLMQALERFDLSRGLAFSTFAVPRIRGAMMDELRACDWAPRSVRLRGRAVGAATQRLGQALGRAPVEREVSAELGLDVETYQTWRREIAGTRQISLEAKVPSADGSGPELGEVLGDADQYGGSDNLERAEAVARIRAALEKLPAQERTVLSLYYYEELNLRQVAEVLNLTESRISQIRTKALQRLRKSGLVAQDAA